MLCCFIDHLQNVLETPAVDSREFSLAFSFAAVEDWCCVSCLPHASAARASSLCIFQESVQLRAEASQRDSQLSLRDGLVRQLGVLANGIALSASVTERTLLSELQVVLLFVGTRFCLAFPVGFLSPSSRRSSLIRAHVPCVERTGCRHGAHIGGQPA